MAEVGRSPAKAKVTGYNIPVVHARNFAVALVQQFNNIIEVREMFFWSDRWGTQELRAPSKYFGNALIRLLYFKGSLGFKLSDEELSDVLTDKKKLVRLPMHEIRHESRQWDNLVLREYDQFIHCNLQETSLNGDDPIGSAFRNLPLLRYSLLDLFRNIDDKERGLVSWSDFLVYMADCSVKGSWFSTSEAKDFDSVTVPKYKWKTLYKMRNLRYWDEEDVILATMKEDKSACLRMVHPTELTAVKSVQFDRNWGIPLRLEPVRKTGYVGVGFQDGVRFYSADTLTLKAHWSEKQSLTSLRSVPQLNMMVTGTRSGVVKYYNATDAGTSAARPSVVKQVHTDAVTDILGGVCESSVVTCSMDGTIVFSHLETSMRRELKAKTHSGILGISYSPNFGVIVSNGMDPTPYLWIVNVANVAPRPLEDGSRSHSGPIVSCTMLEDLPLVVSMDRSGIIKVWDLRTMGCCQTIMSGHEDDGGIGIPTQDFNDFCYITPTKQILTHANNKTRLYEYNITQKEDDPLGAAHFPLHFAEFYGVGRTFLTVSSRDVVYWGAAKGTVVDSYSDLAADEVTCGSFCGEARRFVLGTLHGTVSVYSVGNSAVLDSYSTPSKSEVRQVGYVPGADMVLFVANNQLHTRAIMGDGGAILRVLSHDGFIVPVRKFTYDSSRDLLFAAEPSNVVSVWSRHDKQLNRCFSIQCQPSDTEVAALLYNHSGTLLFVADTHGGIHVWRVKGQHGATCLVRFVNYQAQREVYTPMVGCFAYFPRHRLLYTGDDCGYLNVFAIGGVVEGAGTGADSERVLLLKSVKAHADSVTSLKMYNDPRFLLSAATDCKATIWSQSLRRVSYITESRQFPHRFSFDSSYYNDLPEEWRFSEENFSMSSMDIDAIIADDDDAMVDALVMKNPEEMGLLPDQEDKQLLAYACAGPSRKKKKRRRHKKAKSNDGANAFLTQMATAEPKPNAGAGGDSSDEDGDGAREEDLKQLSMWANNRKHALRGELDQPTRQPLPKGFKIHVQSPQAQATAKLPPLKGSGESAFDRRAENIRKGKREIDSIVLGSGSDMASVLTSDRVEELQKMPVEDYASGVKQTAFKSAVLQRRICEEDRHQDALKWHEASSKKDLPLVQPSWLWRPPKPQPRAKMYERAAGSDQMRGRLYRYKSSPEPLGGAVADKQRWSEGGGAIPVTRGYTPPPECPPR